MTAIGKLWYKKTLDNIKNGMVKEEALTIIPEKWRNEVEEELNRGDE